MHKEFSEIMQLYAESLAKESLAPEYKGRKLQTILVQEAADFEAACYAIAKIFDLSIDVARERFTRYCESMPFTWRKAFELIKAGKITLDTQRR